MIYKLKARMNLNGRGNRHPVVFEILRQSATLLDNVLWATEIQYLVASLKTVMLDHVHFMDARVIRFKNDDHSEADGHYRRFVQVGTGQRVAAAGRASIDKILILNKQTADGSGGRLELRGALLESDIVKAADGSFTLAAPAGSNAAVSVNDLKDWFTEPITAGNFVILQPPLKRNLPARVITALNGASVGERQPYRIAVSLDQARIKLVQRELNALAARARKLQKQVEAGIVLIGQVVGALADIWDTGRALWLGLSAALRGLVRLPSFFGFARPV
jgi:hypothetical protein